MPAQEFALDSAGTERVQVFRESSGEGETYILIHHAIVGSIAHREELRAGKTLTLKGGFVKHGDQQNTTMTSTLTIPSTISGPKQRSLLGTLAGMIVYPVEGPVTSLSPYGTYEDQILNVFIPIQLQLVS
ncbi:MAG TPA: hypothetical protein VF510_19500 [Ktedonobacterales bacterium]